MLIICRTPGGQHSPGVDICVPLEVVFACYGGSEISPGRDVVEEKILLAPSAILEF